MGSCLTDVKNDKQNKLSVQKNAPIKKHFYLQQPKYITDYFKRKYEKICGSAENQMNFQSFKKFMNHLDTSQEIYEYFYKELCKFSQLNSQKKIYKNIQQWCIMLQQVQDSQIDIILYKLQSQVKNKKQVQELFEKHNLIKQKLKGSSLGNQTSRQECKQLNQKSQRSINYQKFRDTIIKGATLKDISQVAEEINSSTNQEKSIVVVSNKWWKKFRKCIFNRYNIQIKEFKSSFQNQNFISSQQRQSKILIKKEKPSRKNKQKNLVETLSQEQNQKFQNNHQMIQLSGLSSYINFSSLEQGTQQWPGQINNTDIQGQFPWELKKNISLNEQYVILNESLYEKLVIIFGSNYKIQREVQNGTANLNVVFIKFYNYKNGIISSKSIQIYKPETKFVQIKNKCKQKEICYVRKIGRQWQLITMFHNNLLVQYCVQTFFAIILTDDENEQFQKNVVQSKEPTIGDLYIPKQQQFSSKNQRLHIIGLTQKNQIQYLRRYKQKQEQCQRLLFIKNYKKINLTLEFLKIQKIAGPGITNLRNTCYMNSVIQIILHLRIPNLFNQKKPFGRILKDIAKKIQNHNTSMSPTDLKKFVDKQMSHFIGYDQQDAHQFLIAVFQRLSQQNRSVVDEYFTGQTQRTLTCTSPECKHIERIKATANVFSIPIQDSGLNVKILYINNNQHSKIQFTIKRGATVKQWFSQFQSAADIDHKKHEYAVFNVKMGKIDEQYFPDSSKNYLDLKIDNSDLIVAYIINNQVTQEVPQYKNFYWYKLNLNKVDFCLGHFEKNYQRQENKIPIKFNFNGEIKTRFFQKEDRLQLKQLKQQHKILIKVYNYEKTYNYYLSYPFCFTLNSLQPLQTIRKKVQQITESKSKIFYKVFNKQTQICYFCRYKCYGSNCFNEYKDKIPIGYLDQIVNYVVEWNSSKNYKQHIKIFQHKQKSNKSQYMNFKKSQTKIQENQNVELDCENCSQKNLDSKEIILKVPIILALQLKRFIMIQNQSLIKLQTKWKLQQQIQIHEDKYFLKGVILHVGIQISSGHFITVIDGIKYDDEKVEQFSYQKINPSEIYILFYQRKKQYD